MMRARCIGALAAALGLLVLATPAAAATADLETDADLIASKGAERTVRITVTNRGPDEAYAGDDAYGDGPHKIFVRFALYGADLISTSIPCEDDDFDASGQGIDGKCGGRPSIAVGDSISVVVRVRVTDTRRLASSITGGYTGSFRVYDESEGFRSASEDPNGSNDVRIVFSEPAACRIEAASPQKVARRDLVFKVVAPDGQGCAAKLVTATLQIGKQRYVFVRKRPQRRVAAGTSWTVKLPYGSAALRAVKLALARGRRVTAEAAFDIDGAKRARKVTVK